MKLILATIIALSLTASAAFRVDLTLNVQQNDYGLFYNAYATPQLFPTSPGADFVTGLIEAENGKGRVRTNQGGWVFTNRITANDFPHLISFISQPWHILLDEGLLTERRYTMFPDLGTLSETDLSPPKILYPTSRGTASAHNPVFEMSHPQLIRASVLDPLASLAEIYLSPGNQTWAPSLTLDVGKEYLVEAYSDVSFQMGFTTPLDELGNPMPGWSTGGQLQRWTYYSFTAVPEPATSTLGVVGAASVFAIGWKRQKCRSGVSGG